MQYAHTHKNYDSEQKGTLAIADIKKEVLQQMLTMHANQLMIIAGLSITSPHDNFVKKIGREIAEKRMAPIVVNFQGINMYDTKHLYYFHTKITVGFKKYVVNLVLSTVAESDHVKLVEMSINYA